MFLEAAKGLLILLVVLGHLVSNAGVLDDNYRWYRIFRAVIYAFHMPVFMFLSGLTFRLSMDRAPPGGFAGFVARRADRLLVPFFVTGLLIYAAKFAASGASVPNFEVGGFADGLYALFVDTSRSPVRSIWFVFTLFWLTVATLAALRLGRGAVLALLVAGIVLYANWLFQVVRVPQVFFLDYMARYLNYFVLGYLAGPALRALGFRWPVFLASAVVTIVLAAEIVAEGGNRLSTVLMPVSVAVLMFQLHRPLAQPWLAWIGGQSFIVYLLNTVFIGAAAVAFQRAFPAVATDTGLFVAFLAVATPAGAGGPIALRLLVLDRIPAVARYVR